MDFGFFAQVLDAQTDPGRRIFKSDRVARTRHAHAHTVLFSQALLHAGCWVGANLKWVLIETNSTTHGSKLHEECSWVVLSISKASCLCPSDE